MATDTVQEMRELLRRQIAAQSSEYFGRLDESRFNWVVDYFWDESHQSPRFEALHRHAITPGAQRILDLSSGCGQFVLRALREGYDCHGVEPDAWRIDFVKRKIDALGDPARWKERFHCAAGESLPFPDDSFDYVTSYQTLEHVADPRQVISEMVRVTKPGGAIHILCPDYRGVYEAHYRLPWLPLFPRPLARAYLRAIRRPVKGLDTIQYVTRPRIVAWIGSLEGRKRLLVVNETRQTFENALRRRRLPALPGAYWLWRALPIVRARGRSVLGVDLLIRVLGK